MSDQQTVTITFEADNTGVMRAIKSVSSAIDDLGKKKVISDPTKPIQDGVKKTESDVKGLSSMLGKVRNIAKRAFENHTKPLDEGVKQTQNDVNTLSSALSKIRNTIAAAFAINKIVDFGKAALSASANMEVFKKGLSFTLGSTEEADKLIASIQKIGEESAYDTTQLMPLARQWVNIGETADGATQKMAKIVDLGSAFGMQTEQIQAANLALTQMSMAGKIGAQDMMQLINAGVPAWQLLADKMGLSVAEVRDLSQAGQLGEEAIDTLWDAITEKTQGASKSLAETTMARFSNMQESVSNSMSAIGDILIQGFDINGILDDLGELTAGAKQHLQNIRDNAKNIGVRQAILDEITLINPEWGEMASKALEAFDEIKAKATEAFAEVKATIQENLPLIEQLSVAVGGAGLGYAFYTMGTMAVGAISKIVGLITGLTFNPVLAGLMALIAVIALVAYNWDTIKKAAQAALDAVNAKVTEVTTAISNAFNAVVSWLDTNVWTPIKNAVTTVINFIVGAFAAWVQANLAVWKGLYDGIVTIVSPLADWFNTNVWQPISQFASAAWDAIVEVWNSVSDWFSVTVWTPLSEFASSVWDAICQFASAAWEGIVAAWNAAGDWFDSTVWQPIKAAVEECKTAISDAFQGAYDTVTGIFGKLANWFDTNVVQPIKQKFSSLTSITGMTVTTASSGGGTGPMAKGGVVGGRIPMLANGGVPQRGTNAIIGEAGPEAVIPLKNRILGHIGEAQAKASGNSGNGNRTIQIENFLESAYQRGTSGKKNDAQSFSNSLAKLGDDKEASAYLKVLNEAAEKLQKLGELQRNYDTALAKAKEIVDGFNESGKATLEYQDKLAANEKKVADIQKRIEAGKGQEGDSDRIARLQQEHAQIIQDYQKRKTEAEAIYQDLKDNEVRIHQQAEEVKANISEGAIDKYYSHETELANAQQEAKKAMNATELEDFMAMMTAKDELYNQSYAQILANEELLNQQRQIWYEELMLASSTWGEYMQTLLTNMAVQIQDGIASGIAQCIVEGKKFGQVMQDLGKTLLKELIQKVIQKLIAGILTSIGIGNNAHKMELKNTASETAAQSAKGSVLAANATAALIAAMPHSAGAAAGIVSGAMSAAAGAAATIGKAAMASIAAIGSSDAAKGSSDKTSGSNGIWAPAGSKWGSTKDTQWLPGMAKGGVVTGPTAALIGEGRYDEAILPLKPSLMEKLFGVGDDNRQSTVVATQNIYGDINTRDDEDDMMNGFNDAILAGLRGA